MTQVAQTRGSASPSERRRGSWGSEPQGLPRTDSGPSPSSLAHPHPACAPHQVPVIQRV